MDDAGVGLALSTLDSRPKLAVVRNCSDPVMNGNEPLEKIRQHASDIYEADGGIATAGSAIVSAALIATL